jgi:hypothetical protein
MACCCICLLRSRDAPRQHRDRQSPDAARATSAIAGHHASRHDPEAGLRRGPCSRGNAALDVRARLARLRDHLLLRKRDRSRRPAGRESDSGVPTSTGTTPHRRRSDQRQPQAQQPRQGLEGGRSPLDRDVRQQRPLAAGFPEASHGTLDSPHGPRLLAAGRGRAGKLCRRARMRVPQHLPGPLADRRRCRRPRLRAGQDDAVAPGAA